MILYYRGTRLLSSFSVLLEDDTATPVQTQVNDFVEQCDTIHYHSCSSMFVV